MYQVHECKCQCIVESEPLVCGARLCLSVRGWGICADCMCACIVISESCVCDACLCLSGRGLRVCT